MTRGPLHSQGLVEYALVISLVIVFALALAIIFGPAVTRLLANSGGS